MSLVYPSRNRSLAIPDRLELNLDSPFARGLVGFWAMGAAQHWGSSKLLDLSPYGNHGTLTNMDPATDWVHDGERAGLDFDGVDDVVLADFQPAIFSDTLTVAAWTRLLATDWYPAITGLDCDLNSGVYMRFFGTTSQPAFRVFTSAGNGNIELTSAVTLGERILLVGTYDGAQVRLYQDGTVRGTASISGTVTWKGTSKIAIGALDSISFEIPAVLDDIRIYNRALSAAEIKQLYEETLDGSYGSLAKTTSNTTTVFIPKVPYESIKVDRIYYTEVKKKNIYDNFEINKDSPFYRGLVGFWAMGNPACRNSNTLIDLSPYGNHGTLTNMDPATDWVQDGERAALDFDGVDDYTDCGNSSILNPTGVITWSLWCMPYVAQDAKCIISKTNTSDFSNIIRTYTSPNSWAFTYGNKQIYVSNTLTVAKWQHVVGTYDGTDVKLYVDGIERGFVTQTGLSSNPSYSLRIGSNNGNGYFNGIIDNVLVYNRALSSDEVKQLYNETKDGSYGSLIKPKKQLHYFRDDKYGTSNYTSVPTIITSKKSPSWNSSLRLNPDSPFAKGLVGFWAMGNAACRNSNTLIDLSPYGNHGVLTNMDPASDWIHDGERAGLDFDGTNDYVSIPRDELPLTLSQFSLMCWFMPLSLPSTNAGIIEWGDAGNLFTHLITIRYRSDKTLRWYLRLGGSAFDSITTTTFELGSWVHLCITYNFSISPSNQRSSLYANGSRVEYGTGDGETLPSNSIEVGRTNDAVNRYLAQNVDDIRIYNRALSYAEVKQLYEETSDGSYGSLVL